jgi:solute carrier family 13 (sodium-dependent dicarboxylate transporter), member 2/3/5
MQEERKMAEEKKQKTGYDKYINWKVFIIPLGLLIIMLSIPTPGGMMKVGVEYAYGPKYVQEFFAQKLFQNTPNELNQWQVQMVRMMEAATQQSSFSHAAFLKKSEKWCRDNNITTTRQHLEQLRAFAGTIPPKQFQALMEEGLDVREGLTLEKLKENERQTAVKAGFKVKAAVGIVLFVVFCFVTEAIPLPMVAFCVGIIGMLTGIVHRGNVASLYWSDATWFIMGSLMFAVAFVKTGVDKRIAMMMFGKLKNPDIKWVTLIIIAVISPLTMFMSDHALAAMFLPIGITLYMTSVAAKGEEDPELGKMLMITIAMAANLGGSLAPSGAARNLIMMGYAEDMFGLSIGFAQWCLYCMPFLLYLVPLTWLAVNWRFKPTIRNLKPGLDVVRREVDKIGKKWSRDQVVAVAIFAVMLFSWVTENNLILSLTGIRFGIGVLAVMGGIAYMLAGLVSWRDYQTGVDWGVVWLYAGAIIFGRILVDTGGAYYIASTIVDVVVPFGLGEGLALLVTGNVITAILTQLMADGPACAAVGPVTLAMGGIVHPGTTMIPFVAMATSISSSFAYCLIIGTPPNAIVYASGYLEAKDYLRVGVIMWFAGIIGLTLLVSTYWRWLGWPGMIPF